MGLRLFFIIVISWFSIAGSTAQVIDRIPDKEADLRRAQIPRDSITVDSTRMDTLVTDVDLSQIEMSPDALDQQLEYNADSSTYDLKAEKIYLYSNAKVNYGTISLEANFIEFDYANNIVEATGIEDTSGTLVGNPLFKDREQQFTARRIRYNFKTGKAFVYDVRTQQDDIYIQGTKTKYVTNPGDTSITDFVYNENAVFTTCDHPTPHFGIRSTKQKKVGNKLLVVGPSNLEIANVPTPLWLPFGFFPIPKGKSGGLIIPRDYEYSDELGFGLRNIGYYTAIGEHFDLKTTFDIYLRGTWAVYAQSSYRKRYNYNGNFSLSYSNRKIEATGVVGFNKQKSFSIRWSHNQDSKAHPYNTFGGSVNIQTNDFQRINLNDAGSVLQNQLSSNISFTRRFPDKPMTLSVYLNHSQNTASRKVTLNFPTVNFQTQTIFPFKKKNDPGKDKWFEKISFKYDMNLQNQVSATDTTLFTQQTVDDLRSGIRQRVSTGLSFKVLKYFNLNPTANYTEIWNFNSNRRSFDPTAFEVAIDTIYNPLDSTDFEIIADTTGYGTSTEENIFGFEPLRLYTMGVSLNTTIYGTMNFKKKDAWLKGLRHIVRPSISIGYTPDYTRESLGYFRTVDTDTRADVNDPITYSIFENSIYEKPSSSGRQLSLGYTINNIFEAKVFSKKDSTDQVIKLIKNFVISGNYNFEADSLKWSPINMRGTTTLFNNLSNLNFGFSFDPYAVNDNGQRLGTTQLRAEGKLLRYTGGNASLSTRFNIKKFKALFKSKKERDRVDEEEQEREDQEQAERDASFESQNDGQFGDRGITVGGDPFSPGDQGLGQGVSRFSNWFDDFSIDHNIVFVSRVSGKEVTNEISTHTINARGSIQITDKWKITIGNIGYDFKRKGLSYPSFTFYRDLHCWEMGMNWYPQRNVYSFFIRVKPGTLGFINIPSSRNNVDGSFGRTR
ncbi:MAG: hypothetical protein KJP00_06180 [Bacteroidia bacterium]|nr:hypothetical protein [Bacteroidia bacterium]